MDRALRQIKYACPPALSNGSDPFPVTGRIDFPVPRKSFLLTYGGENKEAEIGRMI
jgi:hypothetical protein